MFSFLRRLWAYARPYQTRFILGLGFGLLYALTNGALVIIIRLVVNLVFPGADVPESAIAGDFKKLPGWLRPIAENAAHSLPELQAPNSKLLKALIVGLIPAIVLLRGVVGYLNIYLMNWAAIRAVADLRTRLFDHIQNLSLDFFSTARTGELISRITNDTLVLQTTISNTLASMIKDPITVLCLLLVLLEQEPTLTLVSMIVLPLCLFPMIIYGRKVRASARAIQAYSADLASLMHESFTGNRIVKAYNLEDTMLRQFRETTGKAISQMMRVLRAIEIPGQVMEFLGGLGVALVFLYIIFSNRSQTSGDLIAFVAAIFLLYQPIKSLTRLNNQLEQARAASQRVFELHDAISSVVEPLSPVPLKAAGARIQFKDIDFAYGEKPILRGINLTVEPGQLVALVGASGSGKTTLTNLLLRFYDPQRGSVLIGNTDIRQVAIKDLRQQVALVAQETILFNDTARRNIAVGRPGATEAEIETAARHANAHDFITSKEHGYDTIVGEKGSTVSGGQRQRIAIARALLKDAPILVLDEATNSLDAESERAVQAALDELMQGRTTICIAHRLSTTRRANLIVVVDGGRIVESGTHEDLMKKRGAYFRLYELQKLGGNGSDA